MGQLLITENKTERVLDQKQRSYGLDFIKVVTSLVVTLHHYWQAFHIHFENGINFHGGNFYFGYVTEIFFVLSGFVMYGYVTKIMNGLSFRSFFVKRYMRFFPLMLLSVSSCAVFMLFYENYFHKPWGILNLTTFIPAVFGLQASWIITFVNPPLWYVGVLLVCYLVMYLSVRASSRYSVPFQYFFAVIVLIGLVLFLKWWNVILFNTSTARGFYAFFWGLLLADFLQGRRLPKMVIILSFGILLVFPLFVFFIKDTKIVKYVNYLITFVFSSAAIIVFRSPSAKRVFKSDRWAEIAEISFNEYVWHYPLLILMAVLLPAIGISPNYASIQTLCGYIVAVYLFSTFSFYYIEKPAQRIVDSVLKKYV